MMSEKKFFHANLFLQTDQGPFLVGKKCCECGYIQFPQKNFCEKCLSREVEDICIGQRGTLFSFTTTYGKSARIEPPFSTGYIQLPEGVRVFAPLRTEESKNLKIGAEMELEIADLWEEDGLIITGYRYRLATPGRKEHNE